VEALADIGGMGVVYRANDKQTGSRVGLKVMLGGAPSTSVGSGAERFAREARVLADLHHPGIVRYVAHGQLETGAQYLAMEWLEGIDLRAHLAKTKMSVGDAISFGRATAEALAAAHARGVVHRDVNPRNLFLSKGDPRSVKLLDFGIARPVKATFAMTVPGVYLGTPGYMAPEQARGADEVDARADVFALGCVLYECLTGKPAFAADNLMALLAKVLFEDAPRLRQVGEFPHALEDLVLRMLAKNAALRPVDGAAVARELSKLEGADDTPSVSRDRATSLTHSEQRLICVVMAAAGPASGLPPEAFARDGLTLASAGVEAPSVSPIAKFGARIERLADGSIVAALTSDGDARDHASQAARFALALREIVPGAPIVLATGRGQVTGNRPVGEVLDRASRLLLETSRDAPDSSNDVDSTAAPSSRTTPIRLDDITAGLLDLRFEVMEDTTKHVVLRGPREANDFTRSVLGHATPCVGRDRDLLTLEATYSESAEESAARVVLVTGAAGLGKSRVRHEFLRRMRKRAEPMEVLFGRADPMSAGAPFSLIAQAVRGAAGIADGEPLAVRQEKLAVRVARHVPEPDRARVTQFLGELIGACFDPEASLQLRAARLDPMLRGDQMRRACEDWLRAETDAQPVLLVLEDLHWGDAPSVKIVDALLRNLNDKPLMVFASARPEVHALFPKVWEQRGVVELRLAELTKKASERLVREVLGDVPAESMKRIVDASGGNPFCLEELIRAEAEGKRDELPGTVLAVAHARLERLEPGSRRVLRAASVFGQEFWRGAVLALVGEERAAETAGWLDYLVDREVIVRRGRGRFPGEDEFSFQHTLVREAAYAMLTGDDLVLGHRLAAAWLEQAGEHNALTLAEHNARGDQSVKAIALYRRAAEQALEGNDIDGVMSRTENAIRLGASAEELGAIHRLQAEAHKWRGANGPAADAAKLAMTELAVGSAAWLGATGELAAAAGKLGKRDDLLRVASSLLELSPEPGACAGAHAIATARTVSQLALDGAPEARVTAMRLLERIGPKAAAASDPAIAAWVLEARALWAGATDDAAGRVQLADEAADSFERAGDLRNACLQRLSVGYAYLEIGAHERAERALREALAVAERMQLDNAIVIARTQLGRALARRGALDEGRAALETAAVALQAQGNKRLEGAARTYLAWTLEQQGALAAAEREATRAVDALAGVHALRCAALAQLADVRLAQERAGDALELATEAMHALETAGKTAAGEASVRLVDARARYATGDIAGASAAIAGARDRIEARAAALADADLRRAFVRDVENAMTLDLALTWIGEPPTQR
jgi:hypothetical protein